MDYDDYYTILLLLTEYLNFNDLKILRLVSKDIFHLNLTKHQFVNLQKYITVCMINKCEINLDENIKLRIKFNYRYIISKIYRNLLNKYGIEIDEFSGIHTFEFTLYGLRDALCYFSKLDVYRSTGSFSVSGSINTVSIYILCMLSDGYFPIIKSKTDRIINCMHKSCRNYIVSMSEYFKIPEWYIMKNINKIDIVRFSKYQKLSKDFMKNIDLSIQDCYEMSGHHPLTMKQINYMIDMEGLDFSDCDIKWSFYMVRVHDETRDEIRYIIDWEYVLTHNEYLSQKELEPLVKNIYGIGMRFINGAFKHISKRKLSVDFMRKWRGFIKWGIHIDHNKLDTDILEEFCEDIRKWSVRIWHKNLDIKFVENHIILLEYVDYITILTERQEPIPSFIVDNIYKLDDDDTGWYKLMTLPEDELTEYLKIESNVYNTVYHEILESRKLSTKFIKDNIYSIFEELGDFYYLLSSQKIDEYFLEDILKLTSSDDIEECFENILENQNISEQFIRKHIHLFYGDQHNIQSLFLSTRNNSLCPNILQISEDLMTEIFDNIKHTCVFHRTSNDISQYQKISKEFALKYPDHFNWILLYKYQGYEI